MAVDQLCPELCDNRCPATTVATTPAPITNSTPDANSSATTTVSVRTTVDPDFPGCNGKADPTICTFVGTDCSDQTSVDSFTVSDLCPYLCNSCLTTTTTTTAAAETEPTATTTPVAEAVTTTLEPGATTPTEDADERIYKICSVYLSLGNTLGKADPAFCRTTAKACRDSTEIPGLWVADLCLVKCCDQNTTSSTTTSSVLGGGGGGGGGNDDDDVLVDGSGVGSGNGNGTGAGGGDNTGSIGASPSPPNDAATFTTPAGATTVNSAGGAVAAIEAGTDEVGRSRKLWWLLLLLLLIPCLLWCKRRREEMLADEEDDKESWVEATEMDVFGGGERDSGDHRKMSTSRTAHFTPDEEFDGLTGALVANNKRNSVESATRRVSTLGSNASSFNSTASGGPRTFSEAHYEVPQSNMLINNRSRADHPAGAAYKHRPSNASTASLIAPAPPKRRVIMHAAVSNSTLDALAAAGAAVAAVAAGRPTSDVYADGSYYPHHATNRGDNGSSRRAGTGAVAGIAPTESDAFDTGEHFQYAASRYPAGVAPDEHYQYVGSNPTVAVTTGFTRSFPKLVYDNTDGTDRDSMYPPMAAYDAAGYGAVKPDSDDNDDDNNGAVFFYDSAGNQKPPAARSKRNSSGEKIRPPPLDLADAAGPGYLLASPHGNRAPSPSTSSLDGMQVSNLGGRAPRATVYEATMVGSTASDAEDGPPVYDTAGRRLTGAMTGKRLTTRASAGILDAANAYDSAGSSQVVTPMGHAYDLISGEDGLDAAVTSHGSIADQGGECSPYDLSTTPQHKDTRDQLYAFGDNVGLPEAAFELGSAKATYDFASNPASPHPLSGRPQSAYDVASPSTTPGRYSLSAPSRSMTYDEAVHGGRSGSHQNGAYPTATYSDAAGSNPPYKRRTSDYELASMYSREGTPATTPPAYAQGSGPAGSRSSSAGGVYPMATRDESVVVRRRQRQGEVPVTGAVRPQSTYSVGSNGQQLTSPATYDLANQKLANVLHASIFEADVIGAAAAAGGEEDVYELASHGEPSPVTPYEIASPETVQGEQPPRSLDNEDVYAVGMESAIYTRGYHEGVQETSEARAPSDDAAQFVQVQALGRLKSKHVAVRKKAPRGLGSPLPPTEEAIAEEGPAQPAHGGGAIIEEEEEEGGVAEIVELELFGDSSEPTKWTKWTSRFGFSKRTKGGGGGGGGGDVDGSDNPGGTGAAKRGDGRGKGKKKKKKNRMTARFGFSKRSKAAASPSSASTSGATQNTAL